jgi:DNA-binding transcriptional ArsR family regulator
MSNSSINIDLNDPRTGKIATAMSNKTCKKILGLLVEEELSEADLAKKLKIPINTIEYNLKKLIDGGLIEKTKNYFWSVKGKKIPVYRVSNKRIIISPKKISRGIIPSMLISGAVALILRVSQFKEKTVGRIYNIEESAGSLDTRTGTSHFVNALSQESSFWVWFFMGALFSLIVYLIWNWIFSKK